MCCVGGEDDDEELHGAEGDVEEGGDVFVVSEPFEDERAEGVGYRCSDVREERHADPEVCFWFPEDFEGVAQFELAGADAGLVCAKTLDGLFALEGGEEAGTCDGIVEVDVDYWRAEDGDEAYEEEDSVRIITLLALLHKFRVELTSATTSKSPTEYDPTHTKAQPQPS